MYEQGIKNIHVYVFNLLEQYSTDQYVKTASYEYFKSERNTVFKGETFSDKLFAVGRTKQGKPYFPNCPQIGISVSHSGKYIICALAEGNIGVDIEEKKKYANESDASYSERLCKIAARFFHPDEVRIVMTDPMTRFFEVFTAKESYVKFTGTGFDETLCENSVLMEDGTMPSCHEAFGEVSWQSAAADFWQTVYVEEYTLCVCAAPSDIPYAVCVSEIFLPEYGNVC